MEFTLTLTPSKQLTVLLGYSAPTFKFEQIPSFMLCILDTCAYSYAVMYKNQSIQAQYERYSYKDYKLNTFNLTQSFIMKLQLYIYGCVANMKFETGGVCSTNANAVYLVYQLYLSDDQLQLYLLKPCTNELPTHQLVILRSMKCKIGNNEFSRSGSTGEAGKGWGQEGYKQNIIITERLSPSHFC